MASAEAAVPDPSPTSDALTGATADGNSALGPDQFGSCCFPLFLHARQVARLVSLLAIVCDCVLLLASLLPALANTCLVVGAPGASPLYHRNGINS